MSTKVVSYIARGVTPAPPDAAWRQVIICSSCRSVLMFWGIGSWIDGNNMSYGPVYSPDDAGALPGDVTTPPVLRFGLCGECGAENVKSKQVVARGVPAYFLGFLLLPHRMWEWQIKQADPEKG